MTDNMLMCLIEVARLDSNTNRILHVVQPVAANEWMNLFDGMNNRDQARILNSYKWSIDDTLVFPLNKDGNHWITLVRRDRKWYLFDSLQNDKDERRLISTVLKITGRILR